MVTKTTLCKLFLRQTNTECCFITSPQHTGHPKWLYRKLCDTFWWENPSEFQCSCFRKLLLPHVLQSPSKPCIKIECKVRKTKDYCGFLLCQNSHWPQEERTRLLKVLSSACPGWQCFRTPFWLGEWTHTCRGLTLQSWFVYVPEVMTCLRSYETLYLVWSWGSERSQEYKQETSSPGLCLCLCYKPWRTETCNSPVSSCVN